MFASRWYIIIPRKLRYASDSSSICLLSLFFRYISAGYESYREMLLEKWRKEEKERKDSDKQILKVSNFVISKCVGLLLLQCLFDCLNLQTERFVPMSGQLRYNDRIYWKRKKGVTVTTISPVDLLEPLDSGVLLGLFQQRLRVPKVIESVVSHSSSHIFNGVFNDSFKHSPLTTFLLMIFLCLNLTSNDLATKGMPYAIARRRRINYLLRYPKAL